MNATRWARKRLGALAPITLAILPLAAGCASHSATHPEVVRPVRTMVVSAGGDTHVRSFPGKAEASHKVELAFQVPGRLEKFPVKEGQKVAKGELIGQLRQDEFQARLKTLQAQLDRAKAVLTAVRSGERPEQRQRLEAAVRAADAKLANARVEFNRADRLLRNNALARSEFDRAEVALRVAQEEHRATVQAMEKGTIGREEDIHAQEAEVRGLEARVVEANLQLTDTTLLAPYDGVIAERFVEQFKDVRAKERIVKFQDAEEIDVAVDVPETVMVADLRSADILQLVADFSGAPGLQFPVQIREVAQRADPTTQTFRVRAAMKVPPDVNLLPGMTATVTATFRRASILGNQILVPISAIYKDATGEQVAWVVEPDQTVSRRPVTLGQATGDRIEILSGLQPGDRIAVAGVTFLREGMKVKDLGDALGGGQP